MAEGLAKLDIVQRLERMSAGEVPIFFEADIWVGSGRIGRLDDSIVRVLAVRLGHWGGGRHGIGRLGWDVVGRICFSCRSSRFFDSSTIVSGDL